MQKYFNKVLDNIKINSAMSMDDFHYLSSKGVKMHEMFKREDVIAGKITEKIYTDTLIAKADDMHRQINLMKLQFRTH